MKFSITIPAYKKAYLKECIESVLKQTYKDFELIIVNDASPEDLDSIVYSYSDSRIQYYKNTINCGAIDVVDNWNICLSYAKGEYVICMGDDDRLCPNCLEEYNKLIIENPNHDIYHGWTEIIDENSNVIGLQEPRPLYESCYSMFWNRWQKKRIQFIGDFLFKTNTLKKKGGFYKLPMAWGSDDITALTVAKEKGIINSQIPIFQYRINSQTISNTGNTVVKLKATSSNEIWCNSFFKEKPNDKIDLIYWQCIQNDIKKIFKKIKIDTIAEELSTYSILSFFRWIIKRKELNLSIIEIIYAFIEAIKRIYIRK